MLDGFILGVLALNEFVFIKSLKGSDFSLSVLFQFSMVVFIFLVFINEFIKRSSNKKTLLRYVGVATRLPLLLIVFLPKDPEAYSNIIYHIAFLGIFFFYYLGNTIIYPLINLFLKSAYKHENFGKLYGYTSSANKIIMLVITFFYGLILDVDLFAFRYVFGVVSIISIVSVFLLSLIPYQVSVKKAEPRKKFFESIIASIKTMVNILKVNRAFRHFEYGFMFYGFAFMISYPVIVTFLERSVGLNYSSYAFYKNFYNILAIILLPFTGKWLGKTDPRIFAIVTFASMALYILFIMLTEYFPAYITFWNYDIYFMLSLAYLFYGVFAATMALLWFIGSAYFCKDEEAGDYQSVHLSLTAVRAIFAPALGVFFYNLIGYSGTFGLAILSMLAGIGVMWWSYKSKIKVQ